MTPQTPRDPRTLSEASDFIRGVALLLSAQSNHDIGRVTIVIGRFVEWATRVRALPLVPGLLFDANVIDLYIRDALKAKRLAKASVATYRSVLNRAREMYLPDDSAATPYEVSASRALAPYTEDEILTLRVWIRGLRTPLQREKALTLTALGLGCGLRAGEINRLQRSNVTVNDGHVVVTVVSGGTERHVPMLSRWAKPFGQLVADRDPEQYIWGTPNRTRVNPKALAEFVNSAGGQLTPNTYRMRTTWIVGRLRTGVDLRTLLDAAGLERLEKLGEYLAYLPAPHDSSFHNLRKEVR